MASETASSGWRTSGWSIIATLIAADGSIGHAHVGRLLNAGVSQRDLADAVHAICAVHGRVSDLFETERERRTLVGASDWLAPEWLTVAAEAFVVERAYLAHLTAAAGPLPSTPGQAESEAAFVGQRHAFDMLARSDRAGCATGAAAALMVDWGTIRRVLDAAAVRFAVDIPTPVLPDEFETATIVGALGGSLAMERAMAFGAQQVLAQHRGLWDLLEARASARDQL